MMFIGNDLIESVVINQGDLRVPGYLGKFKRNLKTKYAELLMQHAGQAEFLVCEPNTQPALPANGDTTFSKEITGGNASA